MDPGAGTALRDAEDLALLRAMAAGDHGALGRLYERHAGPLFALALRLVRDRRAAEGLLHDVFLDAWRSANSLQPELGRVRTWLAIRMRARSQPRQA